MLIFEDEMMQPAPRRNGDPGLLAGGAGVGPEAASRLADTSGAETEGGVSDVARVCPESGAAEKNYSAEDIHRRVSVEDKRIINCKADVNQLVPFKYKWAWEK